MPEDRYIDLDELMAWRERCATFLGRQAAEAR